MMPAVESRSVLIVRVVERKGTISLLDTKVYIRQHTAPQTVFLGRHGRLGKMCENCDEGRNAAARKITNER
jgi:hypothetical protein